MVRLHQLHSFDELVQHRIGILEKHLAFAQIELRVGRILLKKAIQKVEKENEDGKLEGKVDRKPVGQKVLDLGKVNYTPSTDMLRTFRGVIVQELVLDGDDHGGCLVIYKKLEKCPLLPSKAADSSGRVANHLHFPVCG